MKLDTQEKSNSTSIKFCELYMYYENVYYELLHYVI